MIRYVPVGNFERRTSWCPTCLAWLVLDEARDYLRAEIPEAYANELAHRAERVFAAHPEWRPQFSPNERGHKQLLVWMRHWLASILSREKPALFRQLPDSFKIGHPLPMEPLAKLEPARCRVFRRKPPTRRFVHGAEFLPV